MWSEDDSKDEEKKKLSSIVSEKDKWQSVVCVVKDGKWEAAGWWLNFDKKTEFPRSYTQQQLKSQIILIFRSMHFNFPKETQQKTFFI